MFFKRCSELNLDRTIEFYRLAGELYKPGRPEVHIPVFDGDDVAEELFE